MASRGRGANRPAGRSGPRPPVIGPGAGRRCAAPVPLPGAVFVGPHPKIATVERRELFPVAPGWGVARRRRDRKNECGLSALHHPSSGGRNCCCRNGRRRQSPRRLAGGREGKKAKKTQTRAQQRAAGTNNTALFDIVNTTTANGSQRAPRCPALDALSCPGRAQRDPGPRGYTTDRVRQPCALRESCPGSRVSFRSATPRFTRPGHESRGCRH